MIVIHNNIHNTSVSLRAGIGDTLSSHQVRRAQRDLCGLGDCTCGSLHPPHATCTDKSTGDAVCLLPTYHGSFVVCRLP